MSLVSNFETESLERVSFYKQMAVFMEWLKGGTQGFRTVQMTGHSLGGGLAMITGTNNNILTIFILPPDKNEIERRLKKRETENSENIDIVNERMSKFEDELSHWKEYDYVVTNDNFDECVSEILNIIIAERKKRTRQKFLFSKIRDLTK